MFIVQTECKVTYNCKAALLRIEMEIMYQKLQALLPEFTIEPVTIDNLSDYESVFYNNKEYYCLTDGYPATREICEEVHL